MRAFLCCFLIHAAAAGGASASDLWSATPPPVASQLIAPDHKVSIRLSSASDGAAISYSMDGPDAVVWQLYVGPIEVDPGTTIWAKAISYGSGESEIVMVTAE